ncbi:protein of unknown function [Catalinimonas alkaloidigena]|uniref:3-keto-alpha-glucoside-1,2-lyase/3-keto-2-hydroxy-glucal hydratase domain-containing protein n=1 Tax=Catalinimonas alkaloidigena TaxID=1075417 RepID=A0A1G9QMW2_9BACT|nr:family 16 glycoside hydrolase [Catalinimonas alkaloidigena]SDM11897.1 protein of unknown function [Catalinimonas alkaloidigena]
MKYTLLPCWRILFFLAALSVTAARAQSPLVPEPTELIFSAVQGTSTRETVVLVNTLKKTVRLRNLSVDGTNAAAFQLMTDLPASLKGGDSLQISVVFSPSDTTLGLRTARLHLQDRKQTLLQLPLRGLATKGLEGNREPSLAEVVKTLGYPIEVGWSGLNNHTRPQRQGAEIAPSLFRRAGAGPVVMHPVARYSPDFELAFGYYTSNRDAVALHEVGVLAAQDERPEHQILLPALARGAMQFDVGTAPFGFYTTSPTHTAYSEDYLNALRHPDHVSHAVRTYPLPDSAHAYLVCFEEAQNGDYQDYVFVVSNVEPVQDFVTLLDGKDLKSWEIYVPGTEKKAADRHVFQPEDSALHVSGERFGYIITRESYDNFHLRLEFKWGERKYPPRQNAKRDSGILYHIAPDSANRIWPKGFECQIQEGDVGDFWMVGGTTLEIDGQRTQPGNYVRAVKKRDAEQAHGTWNVVEVISRNGTLLHLVNGQKVAEGTGASVTSGKILLQSEGAELWFRNVMLKKL